MKGTKNGPSNTSGRLCRGGNSRSGSDDLLHLEHRSGVTVLTRPTVYLAGPILHLTGSEANNWRHQARNKLAEHGLVGISPLRDEPLVGDTYGVGVSNDPRHSGHGILEKNLFDLRNCTLVLAYLPLPAEGRHQSFGTIGEVFAAKIIGKPVILVTHDFAVTEHHALMACAGWSTGSLSEGVEIAIGLLSQYTGRN